MEKGLDWLGEAGEAHQNKHHYVISSLDKYIIPNLDAKKSRF